MAFSLTCGSLVGFYHGAPHVIVNNNSTIFLLSQRLSLSSSKTLQFTRVTDAQQLAFEIYQSKTNNLSTNTLCLQIARHDANQQLVLRFLGISTGMHILMLEIGFNKLALKLQIKTYFQQTWHMYVIMLA